MTGSSFCNDPQPPFFNQGKWHLYYLWNKDFPTGNGSEWGHAVSTDLRNWQDAGVAIPKYTTSNGDPWSGVAVQDVHNTAGFGSDAIVALCTMPCQPNQGQSTARWVSRDGGYNFTFDRIVMWNPAPNHPGVSFRDPRIVWMEDAKCWIMVMAEPDKIGFYRSYNMADWVYVSGFMCDWLGVLECPTLFPIVAQDESGEPNGTKWVLLCAANGYQGGYTTGTHYWVGSFDGTTFTPDERLGQWLDGGADFYATVVWGKQPITSTPQDAYYALACKNNWDYATQVTQAGYFGMYSQTRSMTLRIGNGALRLTNTFQGNWESGLSASSPLSGRHFQRRSVASASPHILPVVYTGSYIFFASFSVGWGEWPGKINIALQSGAGTPISLVLSPPDGSVMLRRSQSGFTPSGHIEWKADHNAPLTFNRRVTVFAIVNTSSVEIVFNDGELSMTSLVFPTTTPGTPQITIEGGTCQLDRCDINPF